jgi:hypothetical protein
MSPLPRNKFDTNSHLAQMIKENGRDKELSQTRKMGQSVIIQSNELQPIIGIQKQSYDRLNIPSFQADFRIEMPKEAGLYRDLNKTDINVSLQDQLITRISKMNFDHSPKSIENKYLYRKRGRNDRVVENLAMMSVPHAKYGLKSNPFSPSTRHLSPINVSPMSSRGNLLHQLKKQSNKNENRL